MSGGLQLTMAKADPNLSAEEIAKLIESVPTDTQGHSPSRGKSGTLTDRRMSQAMCETCYSVRQRKAGVVTALCNHSWRPNN